MSSAKYLLPAPVIFPGDEPFWEATAQGKLFVKHCPKCSRSHFYPRRHCPLCGHPETEWREVSGRGTVYSYSIMGRAARPTAPAIIELEEGLRISSAVIDADLHAMRIGDSVTLKFLPAEGDKNALAFTTPQAESARHYTQKAIEALGKVTDDSAQQFKEVAIIGAGHMGVGIALAFLATGMRVQLIDIAEDSLAAGQARIENALLKDLERGKLDSTEHAARLALLSFSRSLQDAARADVVIEAVFEDMTIKQQLFAMLDAIAAPHALLATNTSTLNVGEIAAATRRPESVVGLDFFNPANVMKLIEVIRAPQTSTHTLRLAKALANRLRKVAVTVGICDGFVGNRLMIRREREAARLLLEGALPQQIDRVLKEFGLPMGTFELQDMAGGIALTYRARKRAGQSDWLIEQLYERGRIGQSAGKGYYRYETGKRAPIVDPEVSQLIEQASKEAKIDRRNISDEEICDRLILPMINEGAKLIHEGIVERASDIDLVWQYGYGWPDWKGGPMFHADVIGVPTVVLRLKKLSEMHGERFEPAELLLQLAEAKKPISTFN